MFGYAYNLQAIYKEIIKINLIAANLELVWYSMKIYAIKNCDTVKKALDFLDKMGVKYDFHDYKKLGITREKLEDWCKQAGWEKVLKRKGPTWNKIGKPLEAKLDKEVAINLMLENQSIIVRPLVEVNGKLALFGFDANEYTEFFK